MRSDSEIQRPWGEITYWLVLMASSAFFLRIGTTYSGLYLPTLIIILIKKETSRLAYRPI